MKPVLCLVPLAVLFTACDSNEKESAAGKPPKAVVVEEEVSMSTAANPVPAPRAILIAEPEAADVAEVSAPRAILVSEEEEEPVLLRQSESGTARVMERVGDSLHTAGEKTKEAATIADEQTREAVGVAREKTETGLRKAAGATGRFLQRAGEKIEETAKDAQGD